MSAEGKTVDALRAELLAGKAAVSIDLGGELVEFVFRRPTAREWMDYDAGRTAFGVAIKSGALNHAITKEMYEQSEQLCVRVVTSHSAERLQALNDEHLGIFVPLASEIAEVVDAVRAGAGKASPPRGGA